jgi:hypothetical protein
MPTDTKPGTLAIEDVRRLVNDWAAAGFLRVKNLGAPPPHAEDEI